MTASVDAQLAALEDMSSDALRSLWGTLTASPTPRVSPAMLRLALGYEIQAHAFGGLSRVTQQKLAQLGRGKTSTVPAQSGMRLVREWQGKVHVVTIGENGVIRWNDRDWGSLSEVARAITGTRWSGPAFFGLRKRIAA
jgi:hypothetical protein